MDKSFLPGALVKLSTSSYAYGVVLDLDYIGSMEPEIQPEIAWAKSRGYYLIQVGPTFSDRIMTSAQYMELVEKDQGFSLKIVKWMKIT